jgi:hypothetical protein
VSEKRVVGIRGLDLKLYERIQDLAKQQKKNVADVINTALRNLLENTEGSEFQAPEIISGQDRFEITAEALNELTPLRVEDIDRLIILDDENKITLELLKNNLDSIVRCTSVYVPNNLYYTILKKTKNVGTVTRYSRPWKEEKPLRFHSNTRINAKFLERFKQENLRLRITVEGNLIFDPDISQELFEEIVVSLRCHANLAVSEDLYPTVLTIGVVDGAVQLIDIEGNPIEQIQFANDLFSHTEPIKHRRRRAKRTSRTSDANPFNFVIDPAIEGIRDSLEELKQIPNIKEMINLGIREAMKTNIEIDEDLNDINISGKRPIKKTKRKRVKPTGVKTRTKKSVKIDINDEDDEE